VYTQGKEKIAPSLILRYGAEGLGRYKDKKNDDAAAKAEEERGLKDEERRQKTAAEEEVKCGRCFTYSKQQTHGGSVLKAALHPNARLD